MSTKIQFKYSRRINLLRRAKYIDRTNNRIPFNKNNLNINLITKLDLTEVCVIANATNNACATNIVYDEIPDFYINYIIDPSGNLFGNTQCGTNNFLNYLVYNPPY